ncbi:phage minor head protein [Halostella sp. PRR32]|uniref:phage head morphogenesis protein n=1 Tax=Halostella sp. PRR32 TaxID=3098147 RepID=UPI002B1E8622|nr:phage minor head protein [Halostella sp. PRR32]
MCSTCHRAGRTLVAKEIPPEARAAIERFFRDFAGTVDDVRVDLVDAVRNGDLDPSTTAGVRAFVEETVGNYTASFETVFREGLEDGAKAGRAVASRRFDLDVGFETVPQRTLDALEDWSVQASDEVTSRFADDITSFVRTAHEEGLSVPDLADTLNDDLFEGRLQDWEAERIAQTETVSSSNAGSHSAFREADSVVGEEWLATFDGRQRDTHGSADGQIVAVDGTFLVGGFEADHPGDQSLPAAERINCRCTVIPVFRSDLSESEFAQLESGGRLNASAPTGNAVAV